MVANERRISHSVFASDQENKECTHDCIFWSLAKTLTQFCELLLRLYFSDTMNKHQKIAATGIILALIAALFAFKPEWLQRRETGLDITEGRMIVLPTTPVTLANTVVNAWVAPSTESQTRGLSGAVGLTDNQGMLFVFAEPAPQSFWNNEMLIPIDLIWIADGRVVGIEANMRIAAEGEQIVDSPVPVTHVLELASGWAARHGLEVGDAVSF